MGYTYNPNNPLAQRRTVDVGVVRAETDRIRAEVAAQHELAKARRELAAIEKADRDTMDATRRYDAAEQVRRWATVHYHNTPSIGNHRLDTAVAEATGYWKRRNTKEATNA